MRCGSFAAVAAQPLSFFVPLWAVLLLFSRTNNPRVVFTFFNPLFFSPLRVDVWVKVCINRARRPTRPVAVLLVTVKNKDGRA